MANILIVHAHPEPKSFSSALASTAAQAFTRAGHRVTFSDLYALGFDPVSHRTNFLTTANPDYLKLQEEERHATSHAGFVPSLEAEIRKLESCDFLVFSFPLWWFGLPAILKGWIDRVFAYARIYGQGRWYEKGMGVGKRAMVLMTTGSPASAYHRGGLHASLETLLTPIHHGVFWFNGFSPLPPFITFSAAHLSADARTESLNALCLRLEQVWTEPVAHLPPASEHVDQTWVDRVPHFLITARTPNSFALERKDIEELRRLRYSGILVRAMMSPKESTPWQAALELRAQSAEEALVVVRGLALSRQVELSCSPLDFQVEDSFSTYWAT